jgi:hypothetical protein
LQYNLARFVLKLNHQIFEKGVRKKELV